MVQGAVAVRPVIASSTSSATVTLRATEGPALATTICQVTGRPGTTEPDGRLLTIETSAAATAVPGTVAESSPVEVSVGEVTVAVLAALPV